MAAAATAAAGGEEEAFLCTSPSPSSSVRMNPSNRLKFLCSYGGKILPCPSDGHLKYVGGHTRVLPVLRSVSFSELKQRIEGMFDCSLAAIKYELVVDGLDGSLVSVGNDEDLAHMIEEYDRLELASPSSSARFRLFLFPAASSSSPSSSSNNNNAAAAAAAVCSSTGSNSPPSTADGAAAPGPNGHCIRSTPSLMRQLSLGAARQPHHPPQNYILCRQRSAGAVPYRSQAVPAGGFVCGSRMAPQPATRGRFHNGGGGACVSSSPGLQPATVCTSPLTSRPRKYIIW